MTLFSWTKYKYVQMFLNKLKKTIKNVNFMCYPYFHIYMCACVRGEVGMCVLNAKAHFFIVVEENLEKTMTILYITEYSWRYQVVQLCSCVDFLQEGRRVIEFYLYF